MILRHWPSAWTWLWTLRKPSSVAPGTAEQLKMDRQEGLADDVQAGGGQQAWMSATRPAIEFSIGIMPRSADAVLQRGEGVLERRAGQRRAVGIIVEAGDVRIGAWLALIGDRSWLRS